MPDPAAVERFARGWRALTGPGAEERTLVAVSGGPDSLALLLLAHELLGDRCLAASVDHGLRAEASAEARFVADLCAARGIEHATLSAPLPDRAGRTANISARARALRYTLLESHADAIRACWLVTAHHADDQLETLVMRLNRGAGVTGLAGIREKTGRIVRPLLGWRRAELTAIVAQAGLTAVEDPSNRDVRFDRARLRGQLAAIDWLDVKHWTLSARALGDAEDALAWATGQAERAHCAFNPGAAEFNPGGLPRTLRLRLIARCIEHLEPQSDSRGSALAAMLDRLERGEPAMLGGVHCRPSHTPPGPVWRFTPAPPRRSG